MPLKDAPLPGLSQDSSRFKAFKAPNMAWELIDFRGKDMELPSGAATGPETLGDRSSPAVFTLVQWP